MAYTEHSVIKPEKLLAAYQAVLEDTLVLPQLVNHTSLDQFKGAQGDAVSIKVPGRLPARDYDFRNDRSAPIVFDTYSENKITVSMNGHSYSAVEVTDEQVDFDLVNPQSLVQIQARAVAAKLNKAVADMIEGADYEVTIGGVGYDPRRGIIEARRILNLFKVPTEGRVLVVGSNFESELLSADKLVLAQNAGDAQAAAALHNATLGQISGFQVVRDDSIDADSAYAFVRDGFVFASSVPSIPASVGAGASASYNGFALRWMRDYDLAYLKDRSIVDTFHGQRVVTDYINFWDESKTPNQETVDGEFFLRGVKLTLEGASSGPATSRLASELNIDSVWDGTPEADEAPVGGGE